MSVRRTVLVGPFALVLCAASLGRPSVASALSCLDKVALGSVAQNPCLASCMAKLLSAASHQDSDPASHHDIAASLRMFANTPANSPLCAAASAAASEACGCP